RRPDAHGGGAGAGRGPHRRAAARDVRNCPSPRPRGRHGAHRSGRRGSDPGRRHRTRGGPTAWRRSARARRAGAHRSAQRGGGRGADRGRGGAGGGRGGRRDRPGGDSAPARGRQRGMMKTLIAFALRQRLFVLGGVLTLVALGLWSLDRLPFDAYPDLTGTRVEVITVAPGLAAEEVERLVTYPVEQSLMGLPGAEGVRSVSKAGLSLVTVPFPDRMDIYFARTLV